MRTATVRLGFYLTSTVFTVVGMGFSAVLVFALLKPLSEQDSARDWVQVPCTVLSSSSTGSRNSYVTVFGYSYGGTDYRSDRPDFYEATKSIRYGKGYALTGWIDPADPHHFVQDLHYSPPWYVFLLLIVLAIVPFLAVLRIIHGMATLSPSLLRYLGEKPDDARAPD